MVWNATVVVGLYAVHHDSSELLCLMAIKLFAFNVLFTCINLFN